MLNLLACLVQLLKLTCLLACFACKGLRFVIQLWLGEVVSNVCGTLKELDGNEWEARVKTMNGTQLYVSQTQAKYWLTVLFYFASIVSSKEL